MAFDSILSKSPSSAVGNKKLGSQQSGTLDGLFPSHMNVIASVSDQNLLRYTQHNVSGSKSDGFGVAVATSAFAIEPELLQSYAQISQE